MATANTTSTSEKLAEKAHEQIDNVAELGASAEEKVQKAAQEARVKARKTTRDVEKRANSALKDTNAYIKENPLAAAGIAFAAGVVISSLLRR